jgi:hypothetical protein
MPWRANGVQPSSSTQRESPRTGFAVVAAAVLVAAVTARPYAGAWNDGSRLATVEALVDHHTLAIDDSIFVRVPPLHPGTPSPYPRDNELLQTQGTKDKLYIGGRYYSDKSPVPALLLAGVYEIWEAMTGLTARQRPDLFCLVMTLASSGLAYVVAVWCIYRTAGLVGLGRGPCLVLTASFGLGTVALPYAAHVNNHGLLLGVVAALMLGFARLAREQQAGQVPWRRLVAPGALAGLGYGIDLGVGPVLLLCAGALVVWRCRHPGPVAVFALAALPWLVLHHAVNYATGGTLVPANAVAAYFDWPGCPFNDGNMTGGWKHASVGRFLLYAASLLAGKQGFLGHNLALFLLLPALWRLLRRAPELPEVLFAACLCGGVWLMYAVNSNNSSGKCLSIRWFVPLLAPAYYLLALYLKRCPHALRDLLMLGTGGVALTAVAWWCGPWTQHMLPGYWPVQAAALLSLIEHRLRRRMIAPRPPAPPVAPPLARAA